jgi:soluble lytic murein transglycosylase
LFAFGLAALGTGEALAASRDKDIHAHRNKAATATGHEHGAALNAKRHAAASQSEKSHEAVAGMPLPIERPAAASLPPDLGAAKQAIELIRKSEWKDAAGLAASIADPAAQKLIEWVVLRSSDSPAGFERYVAFLSANPDWPGALLRRRAEARLWQERRDGATVRRFVGKEPASSVGRLALARVLLNEGDRDGAAHEVRAVWQSAELSAEMESAVLDTFTDMLSRADHVARMDRRLGAKDFGAAMRAAKRVGDDQVAVVKATRRARA